MTNKKKIRRRQILHYFTHMWTQYSNKIIGREVEGKKVGALFGEGVKRSKFAVIR